MVTMVAIVAMVTMVAIVAKVTMVAIVTMVIMVAIVAMVAGVGLGLRGWGCYCPVGNREYSSWFSVPGSWCEWVQGMSVIDGYRGMNVSGWKPDFTPLHTSLVNELFCAPCSLLPASSLTLFKRNH
ncbi:MAG: hypothetical protein AMS27_09625 [Bacteroides sp. SM23_62_1]|nr:MAG: hypothetical protein AMS27_09625 [Bacteroides sp. SM23_62_1]